MADNSKQGPKDITDLKARLGLKKAPGSPGVPGGAAPAPFPPTPAAGITPPVGVRPPGGAPLPAAIAPPPGMAAPPGAIPAPPGFSAPEPPPPDPRRDPYAMQQAAIAQNLASFYTGGALPGDAEKVQSENKKPTPWVMVGAAAGAGVLMGILGFLFGGINVGRSDFNVTTEHAVKVRDQVEKIHKNIEKVKQAFADSRPKKEGDPPNFAAIESLGDIDFKEPDITRDLFHTNYFSFEPPTVQQLFNYYNDVTILTKQIADHATRTKNDRESMEKFVKSRTDGANKKEQLQGGLGVIFDYSGKLPTAQLVETLGSECPKADDQNCSLEDRKALFRTAFGGTVQRRPVKGLPKDIVVSFNPTELMTKVMTSDPGSIAFQESAKRTAAIIQTLGRINETEKQLLEGLKKRASAATYFTL